MQNRVLTALPQAVQVIAVVNRALLTREGLLLFQTAAVPAGGRIVLHPTRLLREVLRKAIQLQEAVARAPTPAADLIPEVVAAEAEASAAAVAMEEAAGAKEITN